jgi:hypothetical protein
VDQECLVTFVVQEVRKPNDKLPFPSTMSFFVCDVGPCQSVLRAGDEGESDLPLGWTALLDAKNDRVRHGCSDEHTAAVRQALIGRKKK